MMQKIQHNVVNTLTTKEKHLQESKFELISSEWNFINAMNVLNDHFASKLILFLSRNEMQYIFGRVEEVRDCSRKFIKSIEACLENNLMLPEFSKFLCHNISVNFKAYIAYCENQVYYEEVLNRILNTPSRPVKKIVEEIQLDPKCNGLNLHSYLMYPIKKIQNLPSLVQNILEHLSPEDEEYLQCKNALTLALNLAKTCKKVAQDAKEHFITKETLDQLEIPKDMPFLKISDTKSRKLLRSGQVEILELTNTLFQRNKIIKKPVHMFLFNDILVFARRNSSNKYTVIQYCSRIYLEVVTDQLLILLTYKNINPDTILHLKIEENHEKKSTQLVLNCKSASDKLRWCELFDPSDLEDKIDFDKLLMQVIVQKSYTSLQSDELTLNVGDKINVYEDKEDDWLYGQRVIDDVTGWFPSANVLLIDDTETRIGKVKYRHQISQNIS